MTDKVNEKPNITANQDKDSKKGENHSRNYEVLPEDYPAYDLSFKIIVIGNSGVGKSCLAIQATKQIFKSNSLTTIGFEYMSFVLRMKGQVIKLQIWDTCGQEIYRSLVANFYRHAALAIIVYAIDDKKSYKDIPQWINQILTNSSPDIKVILVGNKADLEEKREIPKEEAEELSRTYNFASFTEVSAKTGFKARELFFEAAYILFQNYRLNQSEGVEFSFGTNLTIEMPKPKPIKKPGCC